MCPPVAHSMKARASTPASDLHEDCADDRVSRSLNNVWSVIEDFTPSWQREGGHGSSTNSTLFRVPISLRAS